MTVADDQTARYLLDTDVLIQAHRHYYPFDICPGFWDWLEHQFHLGLVQSVDYVRKEIIDGDELAKWVRALPRNSFCSTNHVLVQEKYGSLMTWVMDQDFTPEAKDKFARVADGWLVSYAAVHGLVVVTQETYGPNTKKNVKIPNLCLEFGVDYVGTYTLLRNLGAEFTWETR